MADEDFAQDGMHNQVLNDVDANGTAAGDPELEARVREVEDEMKKLKEINQDVDRQLKTQGLASLRKILSMSIKEKLEVDNKSIYVGNVDYGATAAELEKHFDECGSINRVTILSNRYNGHPKGFAYIEFSNIKSVQAAIAMDESLFRGRLLKVMPKRNNRPGLSSTSRPPRGRGGFRGARGISRGCYSYKPIIQRSRTYIRPGYTPY